MILYLVSKGADPKAVNREGKTTADMANGPVQRIQPWPEALALLEKLGAVNNHRCVSCWISVELVLAAIPPIANRSAHTRG